MSGLRATVIIPVYNQPEFLAKCLAALAQQTLSRDKFEVLVVDNGSDHSPAEVVSQHTFARLLEEAKPGSFAARNTALQVARGEIIAFTDADCVPDPEWLENAIAALDSGDIDVVAGRIDVAIEDPARPTTIELFDAAIRFDQRARVAATNGVVTANLVTRRDIIDAVGPFDDSLMSGADAVWSSHAAKHNYRVRYVDNAIVVHPARASLDEVLTQARRRAGGDYQIKLKTPRSLAWRLAFLAKRLLPRMHGLGVTRRRLAKRGYGFAAWLRVLTMMQVVHYTSSWEVMRIMAGKEAERR